MNKYIYGTKEWFEYMFDTENLEDRWGHQWRGSQQYRYRLSLSVIENKLKERGNQKILDLGCGLGDFTQLLYNLNPENVLSGMDISENAIRKAKMKYPQLNFQCNALPVINRHNKFYGIIALDCICYLDKKERREAMQNIYNVLDVNGWFLFSSPLDNDSRYFSEKSALKYLQDTGFTIVKTKYNYTKLYNCLEKRLLIFISVNERIIKLRFNSNYQEKISFAKLIALKLIRIPYLGFLIIKITDILRWASKKIIAQIWLVEIFSGVAKFFRKGRSHIIILAEKR